jgi:hypothetical protein
MDMLPIEKNVPLPPPRLRYPFDKMVVGDSISVPDNEFRYARTCAINYGVRKGMKFITRTQSDKTGRIWRIK